jgi:hypothetical protein
MTTTAAASTRGKVVGRIVPRLDVVAVGQRLRVLGYDDGTVGRAMTALRTTERDRDERQAKGRALRVLRTAARRRPAAIARRGEERAALAHAAAAAIEAMHSQANAPVPLAELFADYA